MYTHDIEGALRLFSDLCRKRAFNACEDARFADPWLVGEEMFIEKGEETVGHYLNSNCDNLSYEEAKALAQEHGFPLEDIWYWLK